MIRGLEKPTLNAYCIVTDQVAIARTAVEYFMELGFRRFAYCGFDDMIWSQQRGENFSKIVLESGFKTYLYKQPKTKRFRSPDKEQVIIAKWLISLPKPIAVMAGNDDRSQDVLAACKIADIKVPSEVAILGVDNDELICGLSYPQLSSIALSTQRAGYEAAQVLGKLMEGQKVAENEKEVAVSNGMKISNSHCKRASLISDLGLFNRAYSLGLRLTARGSIRLGRKGTLSRAIQLSRY